MKIIQFHQTYLPCFLDSMSSFHFVYVTLIMKCNIDKG